jgi:hypothetical protein
LLHTARKQTLLIGIAGAVAWVAAGCSGVLGPAYTIEKQRIEVTYSKSAPNRVSVRAWYRMKNIGTPPIEEVHFRLPYKDRIENLRVQWGGETIASQAVAGTDAEFSARFGSHWNQKVRKEFEVAYDLKIANTALSSGGSRGPFFFLPSGGWYPYLLPPAGMFAAGGPPPEKWDLIVNIPQDYVTHGSGTPRGHVHSGNGANAGSSYRFELKPGTDFDPFVVAGPYIEKQANSGSETVFLWSAQALSDSREREIGGRFTEEAAYFTAEFGLKDGTKGQVWMIECPAGASIGYDRPGRFQAAAPGKQWSSIVDCLTVPQAVIVPASFDNFDSPGSYVAPAHEDPSKKESSFPSVDVQLAATWFPFAVHDTADGPWFPMSGTPDYMALAFTISKNPSKRADYIRQLIERVDSDPEGAKDNLESSKKIETARIRSELFYLAMEDRCGAPTVHRALARIVSILRGQTWSVSDLRSAMEAECGADLADFFRQWLIRPGIPDDFRARYIGAPAAVKPTGKNN